MSGQRLQTITPMAANESVLNAVSLNCESCRNTVSFSHNFCSFCGTALNGEEMALKYYFRQGYEYDVIVLFLSKFHGIEMSVRTQFTGPSVCPENFCGQF